VEGDLGSVLVVLPGLGRRRGRLLVRVEPCEPFIGEGKDVDLIRERTLLRINHIGIDRVMNP
jgi:hypothetical protein